MSWRVCSCGKETLFSVCPECHNTQKYDEKCNYCKPEVETKPICLSCAMAEASKARLNLLLDLDIYRDLRKLFDEYERANSVKTSIVILD